MNWTPQQLERLARFIALPREKKRRIENRHCLMLASRLARHGTGKEIPYEEYIEFRKVMARRAL
jgi:hypothetical protein